MSNDEIKQIVLSVLARIAPEVDTTALKPDVNFREQIDLDSMDFLNFVIALDQQCKVSVPERDYPQLASLNGCIAYLARSSS